MNIVQIEAELAKKESRLTQQQKAILDKLRAESGVEFMERS